MVSARTAATEYERCMPGPFGLTRATPPVAHDRATVVAMGEPAYTRMQVDERRRQLLELGAELFATHSFGEVSMARIAREAGISKALLYHYFPSKQDFFVATLRQGAQEIARRTEPDPSLPPLEALHASLDAFLAGSRRTRPPTAS